MSGIHKAGEKLVEGYEKIETGVVEGYKKMETGVVDGYKKVETGVVDGFNKLADSFVGKFLTREGESVEEARARISDAQKAREEKLQADAAQRNARVEASLEASRNAGKRR